MKNIAANLEILSAFLGLIAFIMRTQAITQGEALLNIALTSLVILYLAYVFISLEHARPSKYPLGRKILRSAVYLISALTMAALLLKLNLWPYADAYLERFFMIFAVLLIILLYRYRMVRTMLWASHYFDLVRRSIIILSTAFLFYVTPLEKFVKIYYKDQPAYSKTLIQYLRNPDNTTYQEELQKAEEARKNND